MNVVNLISKSCDSKDEAAREIVTILNEGNLALPFLSYQCKLEIANTKVKMDDKISRYKSYIY